MTKTLCLQTVTLVSHPGPSLLVETTLRLQYGPQWRFLRKVFVREMLSNDNLNAFYELRRHELKKSVGHLYENVGKPINVGEVAFLTVINMISRMFWGGTLDAGEEGERLGVEF